MVDDVQDHLAASSATLTVPPPKRTQWWTFIVRQDWRFSGRFHLQWRIALAFPHSHTHTHITLNRFYNSLAFKFHISPKTLSSERFRGSCCCCWEALAGKAVGRIFPNLSTLQKTLSHAETSQTKSTKVVQHSFPSSSHPPSTIPARFLLPPLCEA